MACIQAKPIVDGIEQDYAGKLVVLRLNMQSAAGRALADSYQARLTPTFIFFDAGGQELWRAVGRIDPQKVKESINP